MAVTIEGVEVRLQRDEETGLRYVVRVALRSRRREGLKATLEIDPAAYVTTANFLHALGVGAGALAEQLGQKYGDNIDPETTAARALRAFGEECRLMREMAASVPEKLKRIGAQRSALGDRERERYEQLKWRFERTGQLLPGEAKWLNERLAELQGRTLT